LGYLANTEEIMLKIEKMKVYFEEQVNNFVVKDDFSETFQKIDETLFEQQEAIYQDRAEIDECKKSIQT
jgi:hypothetical protein